MKEGEFKARIYPWVVVALLWFVALLNYLDRQMLATMRDSMSMDITELESAVNFGRLMAIFLWIYGFVSPLAGAVADRVNRKWLIIISLFVWSAVTLLIGYSSNFTQIYWLRALMGVSEALYIPAGLSLIADYHTGKSRSLAIGIHMTGLYIGQALGGFGATIAAAVSWQSTFHWFGIAGMSYALILLLFLRDKRSVDNDQVVTIKETNNISVFKSFSLVFSNIAFWVVLFFVTSIALPGWATKNWLPTFFSETLGISMEKAGPIATITIAISSFIGVMIGGPISDRWVRRNLKGRVYTSAIGLALMIPSLILLGMGKDIVAFIGAGLLFGIGYGMFDANNMPILCQFVPSRLRATAYGLINMASVFAGAFITKILGKWTNDGNLAQSFIFFGLIVSIALIVQLSVLKPKTDNME